MQELLAAVPQLAAVIEKGGIIGLFVILVAFLVYERWKRTKEMIRTYRERDFCRQVRARYKDRLDTLGQKVDISDIEAEMRRDMEDDK